MNFFKEIQQSVNEKITVDRAGNPVGGGVQWQQRPNKEDFNAINGGATKPPAATSAPAQKQLEVGDIIGIRPRGSKMMPIKAKVLSMARGSFTVKIFSTKMIADRNGNDTMTISMLGSTDIQNPYKEPPARTPHPNLPVNMVSKDVEEAFGGSQWEEVSDPNDPLYGKRDELGNKYPERAYRVAQARKKKQHWLSEEAILGALFVEVVFACDHDVVLSLDQILDYIEATIDDPDLTALEYMHDNGIKTENLITGIMKRMALFGIKKFDIFNLIKSSKSGASNTKQFGQKLISNMKDSGVIDVHAKVVGEASKPDAYQRDEINATSGFGKDSQAYRADGGANDEDHEGDARREKIEKSGTWYIRLNGKLIKDKAGKPYSFHGKAAANKAALTMQAKLFNQGKEFMLTTNPNDKQQGVAEGFDKLTPQQKAHEYNLDSAQREIDRRDAEGEDMTGATIDKKTYKIVKPKKPGVAEAGYIGGHNRDEPDYSGIGSVPERIKIKKGSQVMAIQPSALAQFKADGWEEIKPSVSESEEHSPVASAITRRILLQRSDLLSKYGPVLVTQAIDEVADFVGDVEEIGSSDVSGWIKQVEQMLANNPPEAFGEDVAEASLAQMRDYFNKPDDSTSVTRAPATAGKNPAGVPQEIQNLINKMYHSGKVTPEEFKILQDFQRKTKINVGIKEATTGNAGYDSMLAVMKAVDAGQDATFDLGGESITLDYNEARFLAGRYKAFLKAGRQEEFLKYMENPMSFDHLMKQLRDLIDKQKNFKGSVQGERGIEEGRDSKDVEEFLHKVARSGDNGFDLLYNAQQGKYGREIEQAIQDMYDNISVDTGYHGDDDFEQIYDRMLDNIEADYSQQGMAERIKSLPPVNENEYWCKIDSVAKPIPEGYKRTANGYITRA